MSEWTCGWFCRTNKQAIRIKSFSRFEFLYLIAYVQPSQLFVDHFKRERCVCANVLDFLIDMVSEFG